MAEVQGTFSTGSVLAARRKYSTSDLLWLGFNDYARIAFLIRTLSNKNVTDPKFRWFEQGLPASYVTVNNYGGYNNAATSIVVDDETPCRAGTVLKVISTGEQLRVTATNSATHALTVQRGWGTTTAASIADNAVLAIIGDANAEGASLPTAITREPVEKYNYTQIFREPIVLTETEAATDLYPEANDMKTKREVAMQVHKTKIEKAFIWGEPKEDTVTTTTPIRATGGLNYFITTNVVNAGGTLSQTEWDSFVEYGFVKGEKKLGLVSPLIASAVSYWAAQKLQEVPTDKTFGIKIVNYISPHGELKLTTEPLLRENTTWNGYAFIVDLSKAGYRYLAGNGINRDTRLRPNRQAGGDDLIAEEYLTECGLFFANEDFSAKLYGVTGYS